MEPKFIRIAEIPNPLCWWSDRLGEVCEVLEYIPETKFYRIRVSTDGLVHWGGIPTRFCEEISSREEVTK